MAKETKNKQTEKSKKNETNKIVRTVATRGRSFQGKVIRKFEKRITIELERTVKIQKFERFMKKKTRIHARLPEEFFDKVDIGDLVRVQECRPLSKTIHFMFVEKMRDAGQTNGGNE